MYSMKKVTTLIAMSIFSYSLVAAEFSVSKISSSKNRVIVEDAEDLKIGERLLFKDDFGEECLAQVKQLKDSKAVLDTGSCKNKKEIKTGSLFTDAVGRPQTEPKETTAAARSGAPTIDEDWYTLWGFGFSGIRYGDDDLNDAFDEAEEAATVDRITTNADLFGFYWPLSDKKSMHGFVINSVSDSLDGPGGTITISQNLYAYSYHKFYGQNIGDGWFIRGDVGLAIFNVDVDTASFNFSESSDTGLGFLGGGGHAFAIGQETRMLLGAYLTHRSVEGESITSSNISLGFLF